MRAFVRIDIVRALFLCRLELQGLVRMSLNTILLLLGYPNDILNKDNIGVVFIFFLRKHYY